MTAVQGFLDAPAFGAVRVALGRLQYLCYKRFLKQRHRGVVLENVCGASIAVTPGVLNPRLMRTGEFFASHLPEHLRDGKASVLDMGTGSGVCAVVSARHARTVVAVDINPAAARCARVNVLLNEVEDRVEVLEGDLFAPLGSRRFDVILFNPPFLRGTPRDDADRAWRSTDVPERFSAQLREHLTPAGFALVLLSSFGGAADFIGQFRRHGFTPTVVAEREYINERLIVAKLS